MSADEPSAERTGAFAAFLALVEEDSLTDGSEASDGEASDGEASDGEASDGEASDGEASDGEASDGVESASDQLTLADVIASLYRSYPEIEQARQLTPLASGELLATYGAYDTKFKAESLSEPTGFYENYRQSLGFARQLWWGGYVAAGYRIGRGDFQPWYQERLTEEAGEVKVAWIQPLLRGRAIDPQRVAVFQASLAQRAATPQLMQQILTNSAQAISAYWQWVAAGAVLEAQRELLNLAQVRAKQIEVGVEAGKFKRVDLIFNEVLIAEREADVLKSQQKFRSSAIKLGLYLRDESGAPMIPDQEWLPKRFPMIEEMPPFDLQAELAVTLARRPELQTLTLDIQGLQWDRRLACNDMLPTFDFVSEVSQDMGPAASKSDDKDQLVLVLGFQSQVPIQRRKARGKIQATSAKIRQVNEKLRLSRDKVATELAVAYNRLTLAAQTVEQREISLRGALDVLNRYRVGFEQGFVDLIDLNLLESKANESEIKLVDAQQDWFEALGELQIALAIDPLEQAIKLSAVPSSEMIGPGNLPELPPLKENEFAKEDSNQ